MLQISLQRPSIINCFSFFFFLFLSFFLSFFLFFCFSFFLFLSFFLSCCLSFFLIFLLYHSQGSLFSRTFHFFLSSLTASHTHILGSSVMWCRVTRSGVFDAFLCFFFFLSSPFLHVSLFACCLSISVSILLPFSLYLFPSFCLALLFYFTFFP